MARSRIAKEIIERYSYQMETSENHYTHMPSTTLDVSRLLQHQSYWRSPSGQKQLKKKTLILPALEFLTKLSYQKTANLNHRLEELAKEGFDIHFLSGEGLESFPLNLMSRSRSPLLLHATDDETMALAADALHKSRDELFARLFMRSRIN